MYCIIKSELRNAFKFDAKESTSTAKGAMSLDIPLMMIIVLNRI